MEYARETRLFLLSVLPGQAFATKDQKAQTVARLLVSKLFSRFGPPDILHSDQGQNFESNLMHEICQIMGIKKSRTTAYHPQGDGQVERQNRTLQEILSSFVGEHPENWDLYVDQAVYAYNTSRHETTGYSPYELVFGRKPWGNKKSSLCTPPKITSGY